jgi:NADPH-dependent 2,4-dienoyl-CoA reductase/sulfur reductase-like enzyme
VLIDEGLAPGGQIWRGSSVDSPGAAGHWLRALAAASVTVLSRSRVVAHPQPGTVIVETPDGPLVLTYRRAVLCPGARELFLPFPGWTLPGVSGAGGLQALMKGGLPVAGKRVVIAGTGPLLLAVARSLRQAGADIVLLADQAPAAQVRRFAFSLWRHPGKALQALTLAPQALRLQHDTWVLRAEGGQHLERVVVTRRGREETIACDHLACGFGLVPNTELPALFGCRIDQGRVVVDELLRTNHADVLCAGEVLGIGGVDAALIEGRLAGHVAADQLTHAGALLPARNSIRAFADLVERGFALRPELKQLAAPDVLLCRCEDVTAGAVAACHSWREARLLTRCGMGTCQGRVCGAAARFLHGWNSATARPPLQPTSLTHLRLHQPDQPSLQETHP